MRIVVLAIYDRMVNAYQKPIFVPAVGAGIRMFQDELARDGSEMKRHPEDYDLYELGVYDDESGKFESLPEPKQVAIGKQLMTH